MTYEAETDEVGEAGLYEARTDDTGTRTDDTGNYEVGGAGTNKAGTVKQVQQEQME